MTGRGNISTGSDGVGYSDEMLVRLSDLQHRREAGFLGWAAWESENSSFGKTFRKWAFYPRIFPLFFSSDHGVHWESRCWPNEFESPYPVFFTWNRKKSQLMREKYGKRAYHVPHPWAFYRRKLFPRPPQKRAGTLVFYAHSNATTTPEYADLEQYFEDLKSLPERYQPVAICLSFHDINKGLHLELRKYGLPLVTAGTTRAQSFVDRFYSMIYRFKYCTSSHIGSHSFYVAEAGIPFFLFGSPPQFKLKGSKFVDDGPQNFSDYGDEEDIANLDRLKQVFSVRVDEVTSEQARLVAEYMGLESTVSRVRGAWILWRELVLHFNEVVVIYWRLLKSLTRKILSLLMPVSKT